MSTRTYEKFKRQHGVSYLLGIQADSKTVKGEKLGILTGICFLAPATESGYNTCAFASNGCKIACLFTAGRASFTPSIIPARITRTKLFFEQRPVFMRQMIREIEYLIRTASKRGLTPAVRLNGTSDLKWEKIRCCEDHPNLMEHFPAVSFYDYTKIPIRYRQNLPANYSLTFSLSESNDADAREALARGVNVAAVFKNAPAYYFNVATSSADESDYRPGDLTPRVMTLKAKGRAINDTSGFVR